MTDLTNAQRRLLRDMPSVEDRSRGCARLLVWGARLRAATALVDRGFAKRTGSHPPGDSGYYERTPDGDLAVAWLGQRAERGRA